MPLMHGKSKRAFKENVATEMEHGKPLKQSLAIAYHEKKSAQHKAKGGFVEDEKESGYELPCVHCARGACMVHGDDMAHGGMIEEEEMESGYQRMPDDREKMNEEAEEEDEDMVGRIMRQRYSKGGMVANEDHGPDDDDLADFKPNEFDDLSLRDDLEQHYTGANSGDEIGDEQEDDDRHDIVGRIMKSRGKKDKMPISGYGMSYGRYK